MKKTVFALLLLLGCTSDELPRAHPISHPTFERVAYSVGYDGPHKQPSWVYERLTARGLQGAVERDGFQFASDPDLPQPLRSTNDDYKGSGFDRGHLCPAGNAHANSQAMKETFYLSNISPQTPQLNRGYWRELESHVRNLTKEYAILHVYSGPLYLPYKAKNGKKYVKYQVIGESQVAVPTHYFKAVFAQKLGGLKFLEAYIVPNRAIAANTPLKKYTVTLGKVEQSAGIAFPSR